MSIPNHDFDLDRIERYFSATLPPEEVAAFDRWMAAHPTHRQMVDDLRALWDTASESSAGWDLQGMWTNVSTRVALDQADLQVFSNDRSFVSDVQTAGRTGTPRSFRRWYANNTWHTLKGFALGAVVIGAGWFGWMHRSGWHRGASPITTYTTGRGERANITLPDGSTVSLNVASRLDVPADYLAGNHTLRLSGEALFSVTHHDGTPFTVIAGSSATRVLGTSFVVRHYPTDSAAIVAVSNGKVAISAATPKHSLTDGVLARAVTLSAQQQAVIPNHGAAHVGPASTAQFAFATGMLALEDMPLPNAVLELNRWYRADIRLGDSTLAAKRINGKFPASGSLADLASELEWTLDVRVERVGEALTLYPR